MKKIISGLLLVYTLSIGTSLVALENLNQCKACHGQFFERVALGKSKVVKSMSTDDIYVALKGYKNGTYGGPMKGLMKGQIQKYNDSDLKKIAETISKK
jgi:cytochrome c-type protein NapB